MAAASPGNYHSFLVLAHQQKGNICTMWKCGNRIEFQGTLSYSLLLLLTFLNLIFASKRGIVTNSQTTFLLRSAASLRLISLIFSWTAKKSHICQSWHYESYTFSGEQWVEAAEAKRRFLRIFFMQILGSEPIFAWLLKSFSYSINSQSVLLSGSPPEFLGGHQKENKHNNPKRRQQQNSGSVSFWWWVLCTHWRTLRKAKFRIRLRLLCCY